MKELWCIRIPATDDLVATGSKRDAEKLASEQHDYVENFYNDQKQKSLKIKLLPEIESIKAVVERWPYDSRSHAENLREQLLDM